MPSLSEQLQEVRSRAEVCLYSGGRVVEVRAGVMAIANLPLPPCSKYHHIAAETMVIENSFGSNRKEVRENKHRDVDLWPVKHQSRPSNPGWADQDCWLHLANTEKLSNIVLVINQIQGITADTDSINMCCDVCFSLGNMNTSG